MSEKLSAHVIANYEQFVAGVDEVTQARQGWCAGLRHGPALHDEVWQRRMPLTARACPLRCLFLYHCMPAWSSTVDCWLQFPPQVEAQLQVAHLSAKRAREALALAQREVRRC